MPEVHHTLKFLAALCDLIGAFFLAVEAIKLENLRLLRDRHIAPFQKWINPNIQFVDDSKKDDSNLLTSIFVGITVTGALLLMLLIVVLGSFSAVFTTFTSAIPGPLWSDVLILIVLGLIASSAVGSLAYSFVVWLIGAAIHALDFVERHTPTGTIGIMGFLLFLIAFVIKLGIEP